MIKKINENELCKISAGTTDDTDNFLKGFNAGIKTIYSLDVPSSKKRICENVKNTFDSLAPNDDFNDGYKLGKLSGIAAPALAGALGVSVINLCAKGIKKLVKN